ncbi:hypothetical protein [Pseudothauera lacus]|uniref:Uncharacterized protein n=1 Tax=Pseudothauera lacus TaxID=2136175 RepID=A0A2T4IIN1_9RHOO|nr:hypothetical protein [Pseudothauera lacus]PTD97622.1 hypothetical protein C8261_02800 [Pseudothauera lacus]
MTLINSGKPPEIAEVDALLGELQQAHGGTVVGGVDISVLRGNLALAGEMQALAMEIEQLSRQPGGADSAALQRKLDRLQALQAQMRFDFMAPAQR